MCDYRRATNKFNDVNALVDIVKKRAKLYHDDVNSSCQSPPGSGEVVIHLRLGDVTERADCFYKKCNDYVATAKSFARVSGASVVAMANIHRTETHRHHNETRRAMLLNNSYAYLSDFERFMAKKKNTLRYRMTCHPDDDLTFAVMAANFVPSGGGFSRLIAQIHEARVAAERMIVPYDLARLGTPAEK